MTSAKQHEGVCSLVSPWPPQIKPAHIELYAQLHCDFNSVSVVVTPPAARQASVVDGVKSVFGPTSAALECSLDLKWDQQLPRGTLVAGKKLSIQQARGSEL